MQVTIHFYSYFKELTACDRTSLPAEPGCTIGELLAQVHGRFPRLAGTANSTLVAVGVDYQPKSYVLKDGDEVSLFPPVQGG